MMAMFQDTLLLPRLARTLNLRWIALVIILVASATFGPGRVSAQTYLLSEGFEGPGYENAGWVAFGGINPDYTGNPLDWAQSLRCNGTSSFIQRPFARTSDFFCYFQVRWIAFAPYKFVVDWLDASSSSVSKVVTDGLPNRLQIVHGVPFASGTTVITTNVTYHVWVEWTRGTGADGTMKLFISTTGVKPGSPEASITTGTGNTTIMPRR